MTYAKGATFEMRHSLDGKYGLLPEIHLKSMPKRIWFDFKVLCISNVLLIIMTAQSIFVNDEYNTIVSGGVSFDADYNQCCHVSFSFSGIVCS